MGRSRTGEPGVPVGERVGPRQRQLRGVLRVEATADHGGPQAVERGHRCEEGGGRGALPDGSGQFPGWCQLVRGTGPGGEPIRVVRGLVRLSLLRHLARRGPDRTGGWDHARPARRIVAEYRRDLPLSLPSPGRSRSRVRSLRLPPGRGRGGARRSPRLRAPSPRFADRPSPVRGASAAWRCSGGSGAGGPCNAGSRTCRSNGPGRAGCALSPA